MELVVFLIAGAIAIGGALGLILFRNPVHSALSLVASLFAVAVLFLNQDAQFLAAVQVIVYAGAILIFYLFVVMLLDLPGEVARPRFGKHWPLAALVGLSGVGLAWVARLGDLGEASAAVAEDASPLGSVENIGHALLGPFALPFELASVVLLAAIAGAVVLARKRNA